VYHVNAVAAGCKPSALANLSLEGHVDPRPERTLRVIYWKPERLIPQVYCFVVPASLARSVELHVAETVQPPGTGHTLPPSASTPAFVRVVAKRGRLLMHGNPADCIVHVSRKIVRVLMDVPDEFFVPDCSILPYRHCALAASVLTLSARKSQIQQLILVVSLSTDGCPAVKSNPAWCARTSIYRGAIPPVRTSIYALRQLHPANERNLTIRTGGRWA